MEFLFNVLDPKDDNAWRGNLIFKLIGFKCVYWNL